MLDTEAGSILFVLRVIWGARPGSIRTGNLVSDIGGGNGINYCNCIK